MASLYDAPEYIGPKSPWEPYKKPEPLPLTQRATPNVTSPQVNRNPLPQGSLQGTMAQPTQQGSLVDFAKVMRAISEDTYDYRAKKEGKTLKGQFDPSKVSGSIFRDIMDSVESARGSDLSKTYQSAVEAAKFDLQQKEEQRQFDIEQENKKWDVIAKKIEAGVDSVYIPAGTLADRNNNPGNLKFVGQSGATMGENGFARFSTPEDGWQALISQIQLDQSRGMTLAQFVSKYAPPTENNTNLYIQQMATWLNADPNMRLSDLDYEQVAEMVARKESGSKVIRGAKGGEDIDAMARKYKSGELSADKIPAAKRGDVLARAEQLGQQVSPEQKSVMMNNVGIVDKVLDNYEAISGPVQTGIIPFTEGKQTAKYYDQLKGIVALDKRQMLKGQGQISDFEFKVLGDAASSITRLSSEEDFKKALLEIKGVFQTAAGEKASVRVSKGGQSKQGMLSRDEITDAISQGYIVEYI